MRDLALSAVQQAAGCSSTEERYRSHVAAYACWARSVGCPADPASFFDLDLVERYIAVGMPEAAPSTRASRRAILRRIAAKAAPGLRDLPGPTPIAYRRVRPPYSPSEVAGFLRVARDQPTPGRRRSLLAIVGLGLGCGLDCQDLGWVSGHDLTATPAGVEVTVTGGRRPRTVIALAPYEDLLGDLAGQARSGLMIGGRTRGRHNVTSTALGRMITDRTLPTLVVARLRSTWLLTHLERRTPLLVLMRAAGLKTVRPLEDLLDFATPIPASREAGWLRAVR